MLPQLFHRQLSRAWSVVSLGVILALAVVSLPLLAQTPHGASTYRVFLKSGDALPSYGEAVVVDDRVVFNLSIGGLDGPLTLQLISLPVGMVDVGKTTRYADAMRAAFYSATRGAADYETLTTSLARDLDALATIPDRRRQLDIAQEIHRRLLDWPRHHFYYRSDDVEKLTGLVADVVNELRAAVGEQTFALELTAGPSVPDREPLMPVPRRKEAIELSMTASEAADIGEERIAILRAASSIAPADDPALTGAVNRRLAEETRAGEAYAALVADLRGRVRTAVDRGDVPGVERLEAELLARDRQLGFRRPQVVESLRVELGTARAEASARRETLDRYVAMRGLLLEYELAVRPAFSAFDGLRAVLESMRDGRTVSFERTVAAAERFTRLQQQIQDVRPPEVANGVHATLVSALRMAVEACLKRREAAATNAMPTMRAASAAAAGALLLGERARTDLVDSLCLGGRVSTCTP